jgi:hypothetical protein
VRRKDAFEAYQSFSARTSENVRGLSFAALAVIWLFRPGQGFVFPRILVWAGTSAVIALAMDFLQSSYGTLIWGRIHRQKELAGIPADAEFKNRPWVNWPTNTFFGLKVGAVIVCYFLLLRHLLGVVSVTAQSPPVQESELLNASFFSVAESLATVAVAFLAVVQIWRELRRESARKHAVIAEISSVSYQVRRQLLSWLGDGKAASLDKWLRRSLTAESLKTHLDIAEERMSELVKLAPDAPKGAGAAIRRAYIRFYTGTQSLTSYHDQARPHVLKEEIDWLAKLEAAKQELIQVVGELERHCIDVQLLADESAVLNLRDEEGLVSQLAQMARGSESAERGGSPSES